MGSSDGIESLDVKNLSISQPLADDLFSQSDVLRAETQPLMPIGAFPDGNTY
jgi:hypothetical protein